MKILSTQNFGINRIKALVYAPSGSGKTSLAKTLPAEKGLIISAEAGLLPLAGTNISVADITQGDDGKLIPKEKRIERLFEVFKFLNTEEAIKKYEWIFIDSLTEISQNLLEQLSVEFPERREALPMWGEYAKKMRSLIKSFRDIPHYHVIMVALAVPEKDENQRFIQTIDINGKIGDQAPQFFDEVFYAELIDDDKGKKKGILRTVSTDKTLGKDRSGALDAVEPADLSLIFKKIQSKGEKK